MDMALAHETTALVSTLVAEAQRLGISWELRYGVVKSTTKLSAVFLVTMDGDSIPISVTSLIGRVGTSERVVILSTGPSNLWIIGSPGRFSITPYTPVWGNVGTATFNPNKGYYSQTGNLVFMWASAAVSNPGSGASTVTLTPPKQISRTEGIRQIIPFNGDGLVAAGIFTNGVCISFGGSAAGQPWERIRISSNGATNADKNLTGADLLAAGVLTTQGLYVTDAP